MKYRNYRQKKQNLNSGFTLVEIILSSSISMIIILVGYYLSNIVSQANKNDKSQIQLFSKIDSATDFIVDEINSGKRIFIMSHKLHNQGISQISLTNAFDTSSFVIDGKFNLKTSSPQNLQPRGLDLTQVV